MTAFFSKHWVIACLSGIVFLSASYCGPLSLLEDQLFTQARSIQSDQHSQSKLVSISYDDISYEHYGSQLVSHRLLADLVQKLHKDGAKTIVLALPLPHTQLQSRLYPITDLIKQLPKKQQPVLRKWLPRFDPDQMLSNAIKSSKRVVLMSSIHAQPLPAKETVLPDAYHLATVLPEASHWETVKSWLWDASINGESMPILPDSVFAGEAAAVGFWQPHAANKVGMPLAYAYQGRLIPSLATAAVAQFFKSKFQDIQLDEKNIINIANTTLPLGANYQLVPSQLSTAEDKTISLVKYMRSGSYKKTIKSSLVLVGLDEHARLRELAAEFHHAPSLQATAAVTEAILMEKTIYQPSWFYLTQRLAMVVLLIYLLILVSRLRPRTALIVQLVLVIILGNVWIFSLLLKHIWLPFALPLLFLLTTHALLYFRDALYSRFNHMQEEMILARGALARNLQSSGQLDQAYDELSKCPALPALREPLYQLALDMERRRFYNKAQDIYQRISGIDKDYRDINTRKANLQNIPTTGGKRTSSATSTVIGTMVAADAANMEKPMLGRYQLEKELGQGAMGVVYLGVDPKIGRKVAIKTLSLMDEFDAENLQEVQERFFREAEAAGRLDHPNIVTIYDAGEEHDLAYIAMDFAPGKSLDFYLKDKQLLAMDVILEIGLKVALALDYAHERNVVHRDIKPSNVMYDADSDSVKVTDFGIAFLSDDSKTKSGIILGSPSYMSPEQVAGKKLDGRSDIYSLGVSMYQLVSGKLPFVGDSLANLMYKITNDKPESLKNLRKGTPPCVTRLINKAMHKDLNKRYATGYELAEAIEKCQEQL